MTATCEKEDLVRVEIDDREKVKELPRSTEEEGEGNELFRANFLAHPISASFTDWPITPKFQELQSSLAAS